MAQVHFQSNRWDSHDVPIPTTRPPMANRGVGGTGTSIRRAKTLTRPERGVAPVPLINPPAPLSASASGLPTANTSSSGGFDTWRIFSILITFWAPSFMLRSVGGLKDKQTVQAWREKMALCFIILLMCGLVGFATVGFQKVLCPQTSNNAPQFTRIGSVNGTVGIRGFLFNVTDANSPNGVSFVQLAQSPGQDITTLFQRTAVEFSKCRGLTFRVAADEPCTDLTNCPLGPLNTTSTFAQLAISNMTRRVGYDWAQVAELQNYLVIDGAVLNMNPYMKTHPNPVPADQVDAALRTVMSKPNAESGKDGTRLFFNKQDTRKAVPCLMERYYAGNIDKITPGCFVSQLFLYTGLFVILGLVFVRFVMACVFNWYLSDRLAGPPDSRQLHRSAISPAVMPEGANISIDNRHGTAPWAGPGKKLAKPNHTSKYPRSFTASSSTLNSVTSPVMSLAQIGAELFAVCLVTCYSEGEQSLRTTLDSISSTNYSDGRKLMFVIADGMITGAGEKRSTPDICVGLLEADPRFGNPMPMGYLSVGTGAKSQNRAMVYAGHYSACFLSSVWYYPLIRSPSYSHGWPPHPNRHRGQMRLRI
jgi:chitin synthase